MPDIIVTCEHSSNSIPDNCPAVPSDLPEHRIYDRGALECAEKFAEITSAELFTFNVSRILVDANRSITNRHIFSEYALKLPENVLLTALSEYYLPFRKSVYEAAAGSRCVLHFSFHSFTPVMNGTVRDYEAGILYDPGRKPEAETARMIISRLKKETGLRVKANKPYKGTADGHTTSLRRQFAPDKYSGIEIEFSQKLETAEMVRLSDQISSYL